MLTARAGFLLVAIALLCESSQAAPSPKVNEALLWKKDALLQNLAKKLNPLAKTTPGDGALGLNKKFPDQVLVEHQLEGWTWIRTGVALDNGYVIDRGIMAFEWAFARMTDGGTFGDSKTIEVTHFLGLYARSILLLRTNRQVERGKRLERLAPRMELSLKSARSLLGERRWDRMEEKNWMTPQRIQAAAAAYWIGRLLANPTLRKTADLWLDRALSRQTATGQFPSGFPDGSRASLKAQLDAIDALMGLAWDDPLLQMKLRLPLKRGMIWLTAQQKKAPQRTPLPLTPMILGLYSAWTQDPQVAALAKKTLAR